jgi:DNA-binding MarR family transcriptional regulator
MPSTPASGFDRLLGSELADEIEFLNARARAIGSALTNRQLAEWGLRVRSYSVLSLAASGADPTQRQLAEFLRLDPSQIVSLVDELEAAGLVRREPDPVDRRSKVITATPEGLRILRGAAAGARRAEKLALAALTNAERETFRALLRKVAFASDPEGTV